MSTSSGDTQITTYDYNKDDQVTKVTLPDGTYSASTYDDIGRVYTQSNGLRQVTSYDYDDLNRQYSVSDPLSRSKQFSFDLAGRLENVLDQDDSHIYYGYDNANQLTGINYEDAGTPDVTFQYNAWGLRKSMTDGTGTTTYGYDSLARVTSVQDGNGHIVEYGYDLAGNPTKLTYPNVDTEPRSFYRRYNDANRLTRIDSFVGFLSDEYTFAYDRNGNLTNANYPNGISGNGVQIRAGYDKVNQVITTTNTLPGDANPFLDVSYIRDANGLLSSSNEIVRTDSTATTLHSYEYDQLSRITGDLITNTSSITTTLNTISSTWKYDAASQITQTASLACGPMRWVYPVNVSMDGDTIQKISGVPDVWDAGAIGQTTVASGDVYAQVTADQTDTFAMFGLNHKDVNADYEDLDFAIALWGGTIRIYENGDQIGTSYGSFVSGDVLKVAVESGVVNYYKNNTLLHTSSQTPVYPLGFDSSIADMGTKLLHSYLCAGSSETVTAPICPMVTWAATSNASTSDNTITKTGSGYDWDAGATASQTATSGDVYAQSTAYSDDTYTMFGLGNPSTSPYTPDWESIDFAIYLAGGQVRISESGDVEGPFDTYVAGDVFRVSIEDGTVKYYKNGLLLYTSTATPTYPLRFDSAIADTGAKILDVFFCVGAEPSASTSVNRTVNSYDAGGQLTSLLQMQNLDELRQITFAYSPTGNRTVQYHPSSAQSDIFDYDQANRLVEFDGYFQGQHADTTFSYNGDSLRMSKDSGAEIFTWDTLSGMPTLLREDVSQGATANVYNYMYGPGGMLLSQHEDLGVPQMGPGGTQPGGGKGGNTQQPEFVSTSRYYHADQSGSIRVLTSSLGGRVESYNYTAYGTQTCTECTTPANPFGYAGQYTDIESGLVYMRARYYDPATQQFISRDPAEGSTGQPYAYSWGNPANTSDPSGMAAPVPGSGHDWYGAPPPPPTAQLIVPIGFGGIGLMGSTGRGALLAADGAAEGALGTGAVRAFAHGTSLESAENILKIGVQEEAGLELYSRGGSLPGWFHTFELGPPEAPGVGMTLARDMGFRKSLSMKPVVVIIRMPESVYSKLVRKGLVALEDIHAEVPATVFSPRSFSTINKYKSEWQIVNPYAK